MKTKLVVVSICMLLISVSFVSVVNAQENKIKMKTANRITEYCEKQIIPRYEKVVFERMDREEVESFYDQIHTEFMEMSNGYSTTQIEIILWLITLIATFFAIMFGYNTVSHILCLVTVSIVCFIPVTILAAVVAVAETTALGIAGLLGFFDIETVEDLIYTYGIVGAILIFVLLTPILMLLYLLAIPVLTIINIGIFYSIIITEIDNFFLNTII